MKNNIYYSPQKALSFNAILNFIIAERGVGKTYNWLTFVINRFIKHNERFIYLRRYKTEVKASSGKLFNKINKNKEFEKQPYVIKNECYYDNKIMGYILPLSISTIYKSIDFPNVKWIIFDEFLIDPDSAYHYLNNEPTKLLELIETVGRLEDIKVICLGNAITTYNPYFQYFNIQLPYGSTFKTFKNGLILIEYVKNEVYRTIKKQSKFGKLIEGTKYGEYAIDNNFLKDNKIFIEKRDNKAKFFFTIKCNNNYYGVWINYNTMMIYISKEYDKNYKMIYTIDKNNHDENTTIARFNTNPFLKSIKVAYLDSKLRFENIDIKNHFMNSFGKTLTR